MAEKLLAPGLTKISSLEVSINGGEKQKIDLYYGNIFWDKDNKPHALPDKTYLKRLNKYLDENPDYKRPTDSEREADYKKTRDRTYPGSVPPSQRQSQQTVVNQLENIQQSQPQASQPEPAPKVQYKPHNSSDNQEDRQPRRTGRNNRQDQYEYDDYDEDGDADDYGDEDDEYEESRRRRRHHRRSEIDNRRKKPARNSRKQPVEPDDYDDDDEDDEDIDQDDNDSTNHTKVRIVEFIAIISILGNAFLYCCLTGVLPFFNNSQSNQNAATYEVVQLAGDVNQGDEITKDDIKKVSISEKKYTSESSSKYIKADGTMDDNVIVLWDNRNDVIGKYATETVKEGDYLKSSDVSDQKDGDTTISLDLNGQKVTVPVNVTTAGNSEIHLYAICTTANEDGSKKTAAVDLGEFKLEGRTISDILNSEGQSKLKDYLGDSKQ